MGAFLELQMMSEIKNNLSLTKLASKVETSCKLSVICLRIISAISCPFALDSSMGMSFLERREREVDTAWNARIVPLKTAFLVGPKSLSR